MLKFKIVGSNVCLDLFLRDCKTFGIPVSGDNGFFRADYEHCLIPCCFYDEAQPTNSKLQLLHVDSFEFDVVFDVTYYDERIKAFAACLNLRSEVQKTYKFGSFEVKLQEEGVLKLTEIGARGNIFIVPVAYNSVQILPYVFDESKQTA